MIELTRSTLKAEIQGRLVTAQGEAYLPGHGSPDFVLYSDTLTHWDDGDIVTDKEKLGILEAILRAARASNLRIEID